MVQPTTRYRFRVRSYIGTLVLIPLIGVSALAVGAVRPRLNDLRESERIEKRVLRTQTLVRLSHLVGDEQVPIEVSQMGRELGVDSSLISLLVGFDPNIRTKETRGNSDAFFKSYRSNRRVARYADDVRRLRKRVDSGAIYGRVAHEAFTELLLRIQAEIRVETAATTASVTRSSSEIQTKVIGLERALELGNSTTEQFVKLVSTLDITQNPWKTRVRLAQQRSVEDYQLQQLFAVLPPNRKKELRAIQQSPEVQTLLGEIDPFLAGRDFDFADNGQLRLAKAVRAGIGHSRNLRDFASSTLEDLVTEAHMVRSTRSAALRQDILLVGFVLTLTAMTAYFISRSLTRPLRRLADRARQVASGDLDVTSSEAGGPREVVVVSKVVDELVTNLRDVQHQAVALSRGDLDSEVMRASVPGALGASIRASVDRLSRSIREREELQEQLTQQATHDSLTGLPNRAAGLLAVEQAIARSEHRTELSAVLFIDLDEFKRANDQGGHSAGDEALRVTAKRLRSMIRPGDLVARLGGDEFLVVAECIESKFAIRLLAERIVNVVSQPISMGDVTVRIGASVGFAIPKDSAESASDLLRRADLAMYRAKAAGRGRVVEFDGDLIESAAERNSLEKMMHEALTNGSLRLNYQPVYDGQRQLSSVEALLRWSVDGEEMSPSRFIPILESSPIIVDIGRWVLREATLRIQEARSMPGLEHLNVAVNLSGRHLQATSLIDDIRSALNESGLDPNALVIEITETALVTDLGTVVEQIRGIRDLGVRVAIDDFGTGFTSIGQLSRLPVDILKIDRAFVQQVHTPSSRRIVELVIELGHTLGMAIVAEGVEDESQFLSLRELSCEYMQGFHLARPMPLDELTGFNAAHSKAPVVTKRLYDVLRPVGAAEPN